MNYNRLVKQIKIDVGKSLKLQTDSKNNKIIGIGHLVSNNDPDNLKNLSIGDTIDNKTCDELFLNDLGITTKNAVTIFYEKWDNFPTEVKEVVLNILFSMSLEDFLTELNFISALHSEDWKQASLLLSKMQWSREVGKRSSRLQSKLLSLT